MKALELTAPEKLSIVEKEAPRLGGREVLLNVKAAGIGGTDLRIFKGILPAKLPLILGQEFTGEIEELGSEVKEFNRGDRVAVEPVIRDNTCSYCRKGAYCLCENLKVFGISTNGGYVERIAVPSYCLHRLTDKVDFEEASLLVPASVAYYAASKASILPSSSVLIVGAGPIGLSVLQIANLSGASPIVVVEPLKARAQLSLSLGASSALDPNDPDILRKLQDLFGGDGADSVVEATGNPDAVSLALASAKRGGTVVFAGAFGKPASTAVANIVRKDLNVRGAWLYPNCFSRVIQLVADGKLKLQTYVSHRFRLEDGEKAFSVAQSDSATKVLLATSS